jgi:hypothetical protein
MSTGASYSYTPLSDWSFSISAKEARSLSRRFRNASCPLISPRVMARRVSESIW